MVDSLIAELRRNKNGGDGIPWIGEIGMSSITKQDLKKIESKPKKKNKVNFSYPGKEGRRTGTLKCRVTMPISKIHGKIPYCDVVDLIVFNIEGKDEEWMRFGYYRKKKGLKWGSQTTLTEPISTWKKIFIEAAKKEWFRNLLKDVIKERPKWDKKSSNK